MKVIVARLINHVGHARFRDVQEYLRHANAFGRLGALRGGGDAGGAGWFICLTVFSNHPQSKYKNRVILILGLFIIIL